MAMKYKTFRALVVGAALLLVIAGGFLLLQMVGRSSPGPSHPDSLADPESDEPLGIQPVPREDPHGPVRPGPEGPGPASSGGPSDWTAKVLARVPTGISGKKAKDVFKSEPFKLSLYADGGDGRVNRLKVDLDRDGQWDEKWSFPTPGSVAECKRQVSSDDDGETYDKEFVLTSGGTWQPKGGSEVPAEEPPPADAGAAQGDLSSLRAMDSKILAKIQAGISGKKEKDPWSKSWKVNLYADGGDGQVNRLKIDLDRDGKWDEKWTIEEGGAKVKRQVSSGDDDTLYDREYRLRGRKWAVKN
ncbi:MAG TPA: hypothetical protein DEA08_13955 [Planctomycetes bacterium]|nr:hypothetical protein [Planctomycetota bacterium]